MFSRPDSGRDRLTYMFMTPGAARGLAQTLYHTPRLTFVPLAVHLLAPPSMVSISQTCMTGIVYGARRQPLKGHPASAIYLHDVHYRIQYRVSGPVHDLQRWDRRVEVGAFGSPPFLGTRECVAMLEPVDDTPRARVNLFEPAMCLSNNGPFKLVRCEDGIVTYPEETKQALANRRHGATFKDLFQDEDL